MHHVLALCGSLRAASLNRMLLRALQARAPAGLRVVLDDALRTLPLFDADQDDAPPAVVRAFRDAVMASDGVIVASPEYAHGISGVLKNGLDWLVSDPRFVGMPVLVTNYSPRSEHADPALREVLRTMSARLVGEASVELPVRSRGMDLAAVLGDAALCARMDAALADLLRAIDETAAERATR